MKRIIIVAIIAMLTFTSCEKVIDIDPSQSKQQPVLSASIVADSTITMHLSYSRFFLSHRPFVPIKSANVKLMVGNETHTAAGTSDDGNYTIPYTAHSGDTLKIAVTTPAGEHLSASTIVPLKPSLSNARVSRVVTTSDGTEYSIRFTLDEPAGDNYYRIRILRTDTIITDYSYRPYENRDTVVESYDTSYLQEYINFTCNDYKIRSDDYDIIDLYDDAPEDYSIMYFTDKYIDNSSYEISISYTDKRIASDNVIRTKPYYAIEVTSYSRDRFLYEQSIPRYNDEEITSLFSEPVQIHTNIDGGIGIFAAKSSNTTITYFNE